MKIRYAPLAAACALMVATTAQAATVTYYFGGTLDTVPRGPSFAIGDSFTGSFTFESTSVNLNSFSSPFVGDYVDDSSAIEGTVNEYSFSSSNTSTCSGSGACVGIRVFNDTPTLGDYFEASSAVYGILAPVTGPNLDGLVPQQLFVALQDPSNTVFNSVALPPILPLSSFDGARFSIRFFDTVNVGQPDVAGPLTYLSTTPPIPEPSTTAMLALGLGALAFARRRKAH